MFRKVNSWSIESAKKVADMQVGSETAYGDVCTMLQQLNQLESCIADDGSQIASLTDRVNTAVNKLPASSPLHDHWLKTKSQYKETLALINLRRSDLVEAQTRLAPDDLDSGGKVETPSCLGSHHASKRLLTHQQSSTENRSPPVCHVKPTQVSTEMTSLSSTAPFNLRNYLIDKSAPITEPVFKPQLTLPVQDSTVKSSDMTQRRSSDDVALVDVRCVQPVGSLAKSTFKPAAAASPAMRSPWKMLKQKAASLLNDGLGGGRSASQSDNCSHRRVTAGPDNSDSLPRLVCFCCCTAGIGKPYHLRPGWIIIKIFSGLRSTKKTEFVI